MQSAEARLANTHWLLLAVLVALLTGCGGGTTTTSNVICKDPSVCVTPLAEQLTPTGSNTTEIVVDSGPVGFGVLGATNAPYVTVTVCRQGAINGSAVDCVAIDHVLLDTGSYGLRVLKRKVAGLALPAIPVAADASNGTPAGNAAECYPFVLGAVWGPLAKADVRIADELAPAQTIQLIDDSNPQTLPPPQDCIAAASPSALLSSVSDLQANGILGIGPVNVDCGVGCESNMYFNMLHAVYYSCPTNGDPCLPAGMAMAAQVQNPVANFVADGSGKFNNNGTMIAMPALPKLGANVVKGRLVFGIETQDNNRLGAASIYPVETNSALSNYLYVGVQVGPRSYPQSYIDTGSNALFFDSDDAALSRACVGAITGQPSSRWYCPVGTWQQSATVIDALGAPIPFTFAVDSADALFSVCTNGTCATAFANLAGTAGQQAETFALGMPFFYGRQVFTSIWGKFLSPNGPWYAY